MLGTFIIVVGVVHLFALAILMAKKVEIDNRYQEEARARQAINIGTLLYKVDLTNWIGGYDIVSGLRRRIKDGQG